MIAILLSATLISGCATPFYTQRPAGTDISTIKMKLEHYQDRTWPRVAIHTIRGTLHEPTFVSEGSFGPTEFWLKPGDYELEFLCGVGPAEDYFDDSISVESGKVYEMNCNFDQKRGSVLVLNEIKD